MGEVSRYPNGTFCWIELGSTDVLGSKAFYGGLLGWEFEDVPGYTLCRLDGKDVSGIHEHSEDEGTDWSSSISVDDVEAATASAVELGGAVVMEPTDVEAVSRMSVIRDPGGAEVCLWQEAGFPGARLVNEVGTWSWNELVTPDLAAASGFYRTLFGWSAEDAPGPIPRTGFTLGRLLIAGGHVPNPGEDPSPRWTVTFRVAGADASADRARELGGSVLLPPLDIPIGRVSILSDPAGAAFTIAEVPGGAFRGLDGS